VPICLVCLSCCRLLFCPACWFVCLACLLLVCLSGRPLTCPAGVWPAPGCLFTLPVFVCLSCRLPAADCLAIRSVCLFVCHGFSILLLLTAYIRPAAHVSCLSCYSRPTAHTSRLSGSLMSDLTQITSRGQVVTRRFKYLQYLGESRRGTTYNLSHKNPIPTSLLSGLLCPYISGSNAPTYQGPNATTLNLRPHTPGPMRLNSGPEPAYQLSASTAPLSLGQAKAPPSEIVKTFGIRKSRKMTTLSKLALASVEIYRYTHVARIHC